MISVICLLISFRTTDSSLVTPAVDGYHQIPLDPTTPSGLAIRNGLVKQLDGNDSTPVYVSRSFSYKRKLPIFAHNCISTLEH